MFFVNKYYFLQLVYLIEVVVLATSFLKKIYLFSKNKTLKLMFLNIFYFLIIYKLNLL